MDEDITISGHIFRKYEPTLKDIEVAIKISGIEQSKKIDKDNLCTALSILLCREDTYKTELMEIDETEIFKNLCNTLVGQFKKFSLSLGYIKAINSLAVKE